jgi:hypothetical protein
MQGDTKIIDAFTAIQFRRQLLDTPRKEQGSFSKIPENVPEIPNFLLELDDFFMRSHDSNAVVLFDESSASHALQIIEILGIVKATIFPHHLLAPDSSLDDIKLLTTGKNLIIISAKPLNNYYFASEFELVSNYNGFKLYSTPISLRTKCILIENSGHVYDDTHQFCEYLGIFLQPCRDKAMSMHPYGKFRLADLLGEPPTAPFPLEITASQPINFYIQGRHINGQKYANNYDPGKKTEIFKPRKPYCSFYAIAPYVPFEIGAGGIANGSNCIHLVGEMDADEPITLEFKMIFAQNMQPIQFIVGNRERILDPTTLEKLPDGKKLLKIQMHPGRPLPKFVVNDQNQAKKRSFGYTFGRFPRF